MENNSYPDAIFLARIKKNNIEQPIPKFLPRRYIVHQKNKTMHYIHMPHGCKEEWNNAIIIQDDKVLKIVKIKTGYLSTYHGAEDYSDLYFELVKSSCYNIFVETEKRIKETMLVFADSLEELGELEAAIRIREKAYMRGVLILL